MFRRILPRRFYRDRAAILHRLSSYVIFVPIIAIVLFILLFVLYSRNLPSPDKVQRKEGFSTVILDRDEKPLYDIFVDKNRISVPFTDIPDPLKKATISIEDKDFYKHQGFDPKGIFRAFFNILTLQGMQGGSTLTQQLVKNVLLTSERSLTRKIKEFILSIQIERKYTKDQILQMYLNEAPYGGTMWGIESASIGYFGKHAKDLTILESAILAGLPQRPTYYSPFGDNPKAYVARTQEVLRRMREDGSITQVQEAELKKQVSSYQFATSSGAFKAAHFVFYIKKQLVDQFGETKVNAGGLTVKTTIDGDLQGKAELIVKEEINKLKDLKVSNGAAIAINPQTGEILAYVGSKEYGNSDDNFEGKFDVVSMGLRQPGSALKPIAYAAAFEKGYTPSSLLMDVATKFPSGSIQPDYEPKNYDGKFRGPVLIRQALGNSINLPAVKITALVGVRNILKVASDMGLSTLSPTDENVNKFGLSMVLGGGEVRLIDLTSAYGVFATGGIRNEPWSIMKVTDDQGKTLYEHKQATGKRVVPEDVSFLISNILSDNNARKEVFGPNSYLVIPGRTVAVKTGTTDDKRDNLTVGYTPSRTVGVWVGNNDNSPMNPKLASGVTGAAPIWSRIMKEAIKGKTDEPMKQPDSVISLTIDVYGGGLPRDGKPTYTEYFIKGTEPTDISPIYQKVKLSKNDNKKLANAFEIATGNYDERDFIVFKETDPTDNSKNRWQEGIDAWIGTQGDQIFHYPNETSTTDENKVAVSIRKPSNQSQVDSNDVEIIGEARSSSNIKKLELFIDDQSKKTTDQNQFSETFNLPTGIHKIKVKATDEKGNTGESEITIGVKVSANPTSTPLPTSSPAPTLVPT